MPENRFYLSKELIVSSQVELSGEEFQHLKVMRCRVGDVIEIMNGKGALAQAKVLQLNKQETIVEVLSVTKEPLPTFELILAQALPRINRLDTLLEKCTELGVYKIIFFPGIHSEKKDLSFTQQKRVEHILISASKQCGRLNLPKIEYKSKLAKWIKPDGTLYYGDVSPNAPLLKQVFASISPCYFFVGPEQGFSQDEEVLLKQWGATGVKLHANTLRTDTAAITAIGLMSHLAEIN